MNDNLTIKKSKHEIIYEIGPITDKKDLNTLVRDIQYDIIKNEVNNNKMIYIRLFKKRDEYVNIDKYNKTYVIKLPDSFYSDFMIYISKNWPDKYLRSIKLYTYKN